MADDEITATELMSYQKEVLSQVDIDNRDELRLRTWEWVLENGHEPEHVENTLRRYSSNFAPESGGEPLDLGEEPPEELTSE